MLPLLLPTPVLVKLYVAFTQPAWRAAMLNAVGDAGAVLSGRNEVFVPPPSVTRPRSLPFTSSAMTVGTTPFGVAPLTSRRPQAGGTAPPPQPVWSTSVRPVTRLPLDA